MKHLIKVFFGVLSAWLLQRPSARPVNQAQFHLFLSATLGLALLLLVASFVQWNIFRKLQEDAFLREAEIFREAGLTQQMSTVLCNAHRATLSILLASSINEMDKTAIDREVFLREYERLWQQSSDIFKSSPVALKTRKEILLAFQEYERASAQIYSLVFGQKRKAALDFRIAVVRPAFDKWQSLHDQWVRECIRISEGNREVFKKHARNFQLVYLALLTIPVFFCVALLLVALTLLSSTQWLVVRPRDSDPWGRS